MRCFYSNRREIFKWAEAFTRNYRRFELSRGRLYVRIYMNVVWFCFIVGSTGSKEVVQFTARRKPTPLAVTFEFLERCCFFFFNCFVAYYIFIVAINSMIFVRSWWCLYKYKGNRQLLAIRRFNREIDLALKCFYVELAVGLCHQTHWHTSRFLINTCHSIFKIIIKRSSVWIRDPGFNFFQIRDIFLSYTFNEYNIHITFICYNQ